MSWFTVSGCLLEAEQCIHLHVELVTVSISLSAVWVYWLCYTVQLKPNPKLTVVSTHYIDQICTELEGSLCGMVSILMAAVPLTIYVVIIYSSFHRSLLTQCRAPVSTKHKRAPFIQPHSDTAGAANHAPCPSSSSFSRLTTGNANSR